MKKYSSIDLDVWGRQFMEAVDDFLSPQKAVPAFLLDNGESLAEIINLKKQVANAVSGTVDYIVKPNQVENTCLMNANEKWRRQEPPVRIVPAREAFHRAELPRNRAHDGLVVNPYPMLLDGLVEVLDDIGWWHVNLPSLFPHLIVTNS